MRYWLHPGAEGDLRDATEFYRDRAGSGLAQSFLTEFEQTVSKLLQHPSLGALWRNDKRRYIMKRFPYSVIYMVSGDQLRIMAVAHHNRLPDYWRRRK